MTAEPDRRDRPSSHRGDRVRSVGGLCRAAAHVGSAGGQRARPAAHPPAAASAERVLGRRRQRRSAAVGWRRPRRPDGHRHRDLGRRRAEGLPAMVAPWEAADRRQGQLHRHPRPQHRPDDRRRVGRPARPRRPARARARWPSGQGQPEVASTTCSTSPTYKSETAPALVDLGTRRRQARRRLHQGRRQGPDLVRPEGPRLRGGAAGDLGRPRRPGTGNKAKAAPPWCLGLESGAASGWPGTDWIEDIVLRQAGPDVYNSGTQGKVKWTDPAIKAGVRRPSVTSSPTASAAPHTVNSDELRATPATRSSRPRPAACSSTRRASSPASARSRPPRPAPTTTSSRSPTSTPRTPGAVEGAGDLFGMFHDTPAAKSLMAYLVTAPAQDIWVKIGGALSANKNATDYPDDISKRSAELLTNAKIFAFDASDLMPTAMNDAFWKAHRRRTSRIRSSSTRSWPTWTRSRPTPTRRRSARLIGGSGRRRAARRPSRPQGGASMDPRLWSPPSWWSSASRPSSSGTSVLTEQVLRLVPDRRRGSSGRGCGCARPAVPVRVPRLSDDRHHRPQLPEHGRRRSSSASTTTSTSSPADARSSR